MIVGKEYAINAVVRIYDAHQIHRYLGDLEDRLQSVEHMLRTLVDGVQETSPDLMRGTLSQQTQRHSQRGDEQQSEAEDEEQADAEEAIVFAAEGEDGYFGRMVFIFKENLLTMRQGRPQISPLPDRSTEPFHSYHAMFRQPRETSHITKKRMILRLLNTIHP
jgi:hypothetical protein